MHLKDILMIFAVAGYGVLMLFYPDFPMSLETLTAIILYITTRATVLSVKHKKEVNSKSVFTRH